MSNLCLCNFSVIFLIIVFAPKILQKRTPPPVTLSVQERVNLLKFQIAEQIKNKQPDLITPVSDEKDDYQYVDVRNGPITPINDFDERKKDDKFRLPELVTRPTTTRQEVPKSIGRMKKIKRVKKRKRQMIKPIDTFYRRLYYDDAMFYKPMPLLHCQDLFTPILAGYRKNISTFHEGFLTMNNLQLKRLATLLTKNTTMYGNDELTQMLYQISNLKINLQEWEIGTLESMLTLLVGDHDHSWRRLKAAFYAIMKEWNLDLSNTTAFLTQAKIYRPPCVKITGYEGSTKTSSGVRYSKLTTPKVTCIPKKGNDNCEYEYEEN